MESKAEQGWLDTKLGVGTYFTKLLLSSGLGMFPRDKESDMQ